MSPMKKRADAACGCPHYTHRALRGEAVASKFINHTLACLVARRGGVSIEEFYKR